MSGAGVGAFADGLMGGLQMGRMAKEYRAEKAAEKAAELAKTTIAGKDLAQSVNQGANDTLALTPGATQLPDAASMGFGEKPKAASSWGVLGDLLGQFAGAKPDTGVKPLGDGIGSGMMGGLMK